MISNNEIRAKVNRNRQIWLFSKLRMKTGGMRNAAKLLKLAEGTYKGYANAKTRYVPIKILNNVCSILCEPWPAILEQKTLKEIRQGTIKRTYPVMRKKYGRNWAKVIAILGYRALEKRYGKNWRLILARRGYRTSRKLYGKNFRKKIWKLAIKSLKERYGENWAGVNARKAMKVFRIKYGNGWGKILMKNARKAHLKKYGRNWAKILSKLGKKSLVKKYGKDYHQELYRLANLIGKRSLTNQEKRICRHLRKNKILYETHCIKNGREYDIVIPDLKNPKIIIESSDLKPTTHNERYKILQLLEQKQNFPNSINLAIFKRRKGSKSDYSNFKPATYNFLYDCGIHLFWETDLGLVTSLIKDYLKMGNKRLIEYRYTDFDLVGSKNRSLSGALANKSKVSRMETRLQKLLNSIKANPLGSYVLQTRYDNSLAFDNFEKIDDVGVAYEITGSKHQNSLCFLAGKIAYLKYLYPKLKFIVILTKREKLTNRIGDRSISKYSDVLLLKKQFNEAGLRWARDRVLLKI